MRQDDVHRRRIELAQADDLAARRMALRPVRGGGTAGGGGGDGTALRRAKCQEGAQTDGKISVKVVDSGGSATGNAFDVWATAGKGSFNMTAARPLLAANDYVLVAKDTWGVWYLIWPTLITTVKITAQTNFDVDGLNRKLRVKTRANVEVLATDAESGFADVHTGTACT